MALKSRNMIEYSDPRVAKIGHPAPPWLVNYADLMTELVCFFVILYAFAAALNKDVQKTKKEVEETVKEEKAEKQVETKMTKEGLEITFSENIGVPFFESGSADLSPGMVKFLDKYAPKFPKVETSEIWVQGHTDSDPISGKYESNWELSTARASSVVKYLLRRHEFPPKGLVAMGFGEYRPKVANDTPQNKAVNRRVVFLIKNASPQSKEHKEEKKEE